MSDGIRDALDAWLRNHHGVVDRATLLRLGATRRQADHLVVSERLIPMHRGIYRSPAHPVTDRQLMVASCLLQPSAAVAFTSAGQEWGFRGMRHPGVHVLVPHGVRFLLDGVTVHRCRQIDPVDVTGTRADGIRLTSPPRTLLDSAAQIGPEATESAIEQAIAEGRCTIPTLMSTKRRLGHPNRPGARVFTTVLDARPVWRRAARSELEREFRAALEARGLPQPEINMTLVLPDGTPIEIDLAWPDYTVALEVDHPFWHDGSREARRDKRRDRRLAGMGWLPQRVTDADIDGDLERTLDELDAILRQRGWARTGAA